MQSLKVVVPLIIACFVMAGCEPAATPTEEPLGNISNTDLQARIEGGTAPLILDVRGADEYTDGHIAGALNIAHTDVEGSLSKLPADRSTEIVVHCHSGKRAAQAEAVLAAAGFTNVRHLDGDYVGWQAAGLPLE